MVWFRRQTRIVVTGNERPQVGKLLVIVDDQYWYRLAGLRVEVTRRGTNQKFYGNIVHQVHKGAWQSVAFFPMLPIGEYRVWMDGTGQQWPPAYQQPRFTVVTVFPYQTVKVDFTC